VIDLLFLHWVCLLQVVQKFCKLDVVSILFNFNSQLSRSQSHCIFKTLSCALWAFYVSDHKYLFAFIAFAFSFLPMHAFVIKGAHSFIYACFIFLLSRYFSINAFYSLVKATYLTRRCHIRMVKCRLNFLIKLIFIHVCDVLHFHLVAQLKITWRCL